MSDIHNWSTSEAGNNSAPPDGLPEGMLPSTVNNSVREIMAAIRRRDKDTDGSLVSTGSVGAYAVTLNQTISAYYDGLTVTFEANHENPGSSTLDAGKGAASIVWPDGTPLPAADIPAGAKVTVTYDSDNSRWQKRTIAVPPASASLSSGLPVGATMMWWGTSPPTDWLLLNGDTIGSGSSGATHAGDDYGALFAFLWDNLADAQAAVVGGRGGSAADDWSSNKRLTLPDASGRVPMGIDTAGAVVTSASVGGADADVMAATGGAETHTLSESEAPSHTHASGTLSAASDGSTHRHNIKTTIESHQNGSIKAARRSQVNSSAISYTALRTEYDGGNHTHSVAGDTASAGSDAAHSNTQPWLTFNFIIRARAVQDIAAIETGGGSIAVEDEGASVVASASTLNFTGTGVTASDAGGGKATITVSGGSAPVDSVNGQTGVVVLDADDIDDAATAHKFVTAADVTNLSNLSGTNTGDQTITLTGDVTGSGAGSFATTVAEGAVTQHEAALQIASTQISDSTAAGRSMLTAASATAQRTLLNVEDGATADQSDSEIETAYSNQVSVVSQAAAEAGTSTTVYRWTPERVAQAIAALETGGGSIAVEDEGASVVASASTLNFTGTGVTAADAGGGEVTVTIAGGSAPVDSVNSQTGVVVLDADDIDDAATAHKFVTAADVTNLSNLSGTNTGDQTGAEIATSLDAELGHADWRVDRSISDSVGTDTHSSAAAYTPNCADGSYRDVTVSAEITILNPPTNLPAEAKVCTLYLTASGNQQITALDAAIAFDGQLPITLMDTKTTLLFLISVDGVNWVLAGGGVTSSEILDSTAAGRDLLTAASLSAQQGILAPTVATGNLVQIVDVGGNPGLPVMDGSQLTGISGGGGTAFDAVALSNETQEIVAGKHYIVSGAATLTLQLIAGDHKIIVQNNTSSALTISANAADTITHDNSTGNTTHDIPAWGTAAFMSVSGTAIWHVESSMATTGDGSAVVTGTAGSADAPAVWDANGNLVGGTVQAGMNVPAVDGSANRNMSLATDLAGKHEGYIRLSAAAATYTTVSGEFGADDVGKQVHVRFTNAAPSGGGITQGASTTVNGSRTIDTQYETVTLVCVAADTFDLIPGMDAA